MLQTWRVGLSFAVKRGFTGSLIGLVLYSVPELHLVNDEEKMAIDCMEW